MNIGLTCHRTMRWLLILALSAAPVLADEKKGSAKEDSKPEPTLGELLTVNAETIFGAKIIWDAAAGTVSLLISSSKEFEEVFTGKGILKPGDLPPGLQRMMMKHPTEKGNVKNVAVVGHGAGKWAFKFEKIGDYTIKFDIRPHDLSGRSQLAFLTNRAKRDGDRKDSYIRTDFLQSQATVYENGRKARKRKVQHEGEFKGPPSVWFGSRSMTSVTLTYADGLFSVKLGKDKSFLELQADDLPGGTWGVQFQKFSFVMSNLSVTAKFDRDWLRTQIDALRKDGELELPKGYEHVAKKDDARRAKKRRKREAEIEL